MESQIKNLIIGTIFGTLIGTTIQSNIHKNEHLTETGDYHVVFEYKTSDDIVKEDCVLTVHNAGEKTALEKYYAINHKLVSIYNNKNNHLPKLDKFTILSINKL